MKEGEIVNETFTNILTINERVRFVRKDLNMTQVQFANALGIKQNTISYIEKNGNPVNERNCKLICKTFNIDYFWLTKGIGEPYIGVPDLILEEAIAEYNLDETDKKLIEEYIKLEPEIRDAIKAYLSNVFSK